MQKRHKPSLFGFSQYLEQYLWKNFASTTASRDHIMSIIIMVNEKFRERVPAWQCFAKQPEHFPELFKLVTELSLNKELSFAEQCSVISFLDNCFNSLEVDCVRVEVMKLCSLTVWVNLLPVCALSLWQHIDGYFSLN